MKLLVDSDAYCKLGVAGPLADALGVIGVDIAECYKLPALPHMLRRGRLRRNYGAEACDRMLATAEAMPAMVQPSGLWLDRLLKIDTVDPGEAAILAAGAEFGHLVITGDKRALHAAKDVEGLAVALQGRLIVLEPVLIRRERRGDFEYTLTQISYDSCRYPNGRMDCRGEPVTICIADTPKLRARIRRQHQCGVRVLDRL